jgi:hypothetical protein
MTEAIIHERFGLVFQETKGRFTTRKFVTWENKVSQAKELERIVK